ncbi:MAG: hypothetical protein SFV15_19850 [Polyangiaceae bacterium]|nr:hypothetical protein [Polyangiaceae bacterium]
MRSLDNGIEWCRLETPASLTDVRPAPSDPLLLIGVTADTPANADLARSVLQSTDGGVTWKPMRATTPVEQAPISVLAISLTDPKAVWLQTAQGPAFTRNGGSSWTNVSPLPAAKPGEFLTPGALLIDWRDPSHLYQPFEVFDPTSNMDAKSWLRRSTDWGATWEQVSLPVSLPATLPFAIDSNAALWATDTTRTTGFLTRSQNGGSSWESIDTGQTTPVYPVVQQPSPEGHVLVASEPNVGETLGGGLVAQTVDGGVTWTPAPMPFASMQSYNARNWRLLSVGPEPEKLAIETTLGIHTTTDSGATWSLKADPHRALRVAITGLNPNSIWAATEQGAMRSADGGLNWKAAPVPFHGLPTALVAHPHQEGMAFALDEESDKGGAGGVHLYKSDNDSWVRLGTTFAGSQASLVISADGDRLYVSTTAGIYCSADQGETWSAPYLPPEGANVLPFGIAVDPIDSHRVLFRSAMVFQLAELCDAPFVVQQSALPIDPITDASGAVSFTAGNGVLLIGGQTGVHRSTDGGTTWTEANTGIVPSMPRALPGDAVSAFFNAPGSKNVVYAMTPSGIFRSVDAGETWSQVTKGPATVAGGGSAVPANGGYFAPLPNKPEVFLYLGFISPAANVGSQGQNVGLLSIRVP